MTFHCQNVLFCTLFTLNLTNLLLWNQYWCLLSLQLSSSRANRNLATQVTTLLALYSLGFPWSPLSSKWMNISEIIEDEDDVENENNGFIIGFTKCARSRSSCVTSMIQYHAFAWTSYTSKFGQVLYCQKTKVLVKVLLKSVWIAVLISARFQLLRYFPI